MDQRIIAFEKKFTKPNLPEIRPGDTVRVHQRIEESGKTRTHQFEGICIATRHGRGMSGSFTVRKTGAGGIGVEQTFFWHAPSLFKVERVRKGDVRRAKLYYLRRLTTRQTKRLGSTHVGEVWEEKGVTEQVKHEQAEQAEAEVEEGESEGEKEGEAPSEDQKPKTEDESKANEKIDQAAGEPGGEAGSGVSPEEKLPDSGPQS